MSKVKLAFLCVHNSCRSQLAEALATLLAGDVFESHSAGEQVKDQINPDAVRLFREHYGVDMTQTQYSKHFEQLPAVDIVVTMGCNVTCPHIPCQQREDWGIEDPTGQSDEVFLQTIARIREKVLDLAQRVRAEQSADEAK